MVPAFGALTSLTGGGGLSAPSSASSGTDGGNASFGGISFGSPQAGQQQSINLAVIAVALVAAVIVIKKVK